MSELRKATLRQIRYLAAVLRTGSVTAAAAEQHVTPPAITGQIKALEELAGVALVERSGDRFRATQAGQEVATALAQIEGALTNCDHALDRMRYADQGCVSLGIVSPVQYFAPKALADFQRLQPGVKLRIQIGNRETILAALLRCDLDLAITGSMPPECPVIAEEIGDHPMVMIACPGHELAARSGLSFADLAGETFLVREPRSGTRGWFERLTSRVPALAQRREIMLPYNETIKQSVMAGLGVAFISAHAIVAELAARRLAVLDVLGTPVMRKWYVAHHARKRLQPATAALRRFWLAHGCEYLPSFSAASTFM
ncbi:transcriptional regulator, LysR family [Rhodoblastus acidophilus]|uniref:HTH-type transcriptional regulator CbbR n=1 Tax=Rhodoblastus acidophilus TaxID=1074 RepID=A0A212R1T8_RHOAC|nr:LysR family transcriptional regulator [Rhodoblastus acidophilus]MCW2314594.1 LysR family transcriptional regulator for metE and metH [Rhodoblastus acidophilus]PPQ40381.1 LysR family transcriptional regulator [Rhodoblastus acidophilus]RAI22275.1 LysR family transcriptional regulator [Rhodoblastus acidophilus]SNB65808.1 transcriptional regulator, LysR family [Rhodoblastus acidophilus]